MQPGVSIRIGSGKPYGAASPVRYGATTAESTASQLARYGTRVVQTGWARAVQAAKTGTAISCALAVKAIAAYPEAVVAASAALCARGLGARNGTLLGASPCRTTLATLLAAAAVRDSLALKWAGSVVPLNEAASSSLQAALGR